MWLGWKLIEETSEKAVVFYQQTGEGAGYDWVRP